MSVLTMKRTAVSPGIGGHARRHNAVSLGDSPTVLCLRALGDLEEHEEATRHYNPANRRKSWLGWVESGIVTPGLSAAAGDHARLPSAGEGRPDALLQEKSCCLAGAAAGYDRAGGLAMNDVRIVKGPPAVDPRQLAERIREYLAGTGVLKGILFGSFARGDADFASDADLVLVEDTDRPFVERGMAHLPLFRLGVGLDLIVYTPAEYERLIEEGNPFVRRVAEEGEVIYVRPT